jgi:hypothetical protein
VFFTCLYAYITAICPITESEWKIVVIVVVVVEDDDNERKGSIHVGHWFKHFHLEDLL